MSICCRGTVINFGYDLFTAEICLGDDLVHGEWISGPQQVVNTYLVHIEFRGRRPGTAG